MWSTVLYICLSLSFSLCLHLTTLCTLALSSTLLFIASPSEPPSLIIIVVVVVVFIVAYILSDPSPPFHLAAAGEESEGEKRKGAGPNYGRGPPLSLFSRS